MAFSGQGFSGAFKFDVEDSFGGGTPGTPSWKRGSDYIRSVTISTAHERIELRDISSRQLQKVVMGTKKWTLEVEYIPQRPESGTQSNQLFYNHTADGSTDTGITNTSLYIEIGFGGVVLHAKGCVSNELNISGSKNEELVITQSFAVKELTADTSASSGSASALGTNPYVFNGAAFTRGGNTVAYATESFDLTVSNNIDDDIVDIGSSTVKMLVAGQLEISGSADIVGESSDITGILSNADNISTAAMQVSLGDTSGDDYISLSGAYWTDPEYTPANDKTAVRESVPFAAQSWSLGSIT